MRELKQFSNWIKRQVPALSLYLFFLILSVCTVSAASTKEEREQVLHQARDLRKLWNRTSLEASLALFLESAEAIEREGNLASAASCMREAGRVERMLGNKEAALTSLLRALDLSRNASDKNEEVKILSDLGSLTFELGLAKNSRNYLSEAKKLVTQITDPAAQAVAYWAAGENLYFQDQLEEAETDLVKAIDLFRTVNDAAGECDAHISLGYVYAQLNRYDDALASFTTALTTAEGANEPRAVTASLKALGTGNYLRGDPQTALGYYRRCLDLFPEDIDLSERAVVYNGTGSVYEYFGDFESSILERQKALALFRKDKFVYGEMATMFSLGTSSLASDRTDDARTYFLEVRRLAKIQSNTLYLTYSYIGLGDISLKSNDLADARERYVDAKDSIEPNSNRRQYAIVTEKIGDTYLAENKLDQARERFLVSLDLNWEVRDEFSEADLYYKLAKIESLRSRLDEALAMARRSVEISEKITADLLDSQLKTRYLSNAHDRYDLCISLLMRLEKQRPGVGYSAQALELSERARARLLLERMQLSSARLAKETSPELAKSENELLAELNSQRNKLSDLLSSGEDSDGAKKAEDDARETHNRLEIVRSERKQANPQYAAIKDPKPFDPVRFQQDVLDDDSIFLEFSLGTQESFLWLIDKTTVFHYVLPPRDQIESKVANFLAIMRSRERLGDESIDNYSARVAGADLDFTSAAAALSVDLLSPAVEQLRGKRLIISTDGGLGQLPFAALPFPDSTSGEPLIATNEVAYAPSASMLSLLRSTGMDQRPAQAKDLMVIADPVFAASDERLTGREPDQSIFETSLALLRSGDSIKELGRLPASQTEAVSVTNIIGNSTIASGFSANRERVLNGDLANYRVIHFATHGILNEKHPELSGILLSLFDDNGKASEGFIREQDIYGLGLNADLVVLSACSSGVGKEVRGEGTLSLNIAFLQAGARSVVSSLWKVDDNATEKLMRHFYQAMADGGNTPAQALRLAQIELSKDARYSSPFYWAAFTIQGDSGSKLTFSSRNWNYIAAGAGLVLIAVFLVLWGGRSYRRRVTRP